MGVTVPGGRYLTATGWRNGRGEVVDAPDPGEGFTEAVRDAGAQFVDAVTRFDEDAKAKPARKPRARK